ncbi:hypothetical protein L208DRAFT_1420849 [Tricholoma matsutake]|nr:hypothetical protein L208DRAFT_1420849 [Tricholoma matsutake 945]
MTRRNVAASTTTTLQATSVAIASESPQLKMYMCSLMEQSGLTEQEVRKCVVETYGSLKYAKQAMETAEAENKAAIERAFPKGYAEIQVGRKPKPREEVTFSQLRDDLMVRVWGGDLASYEYYCFNFVNRECQYILTPHDIKIYSVATAFSLSAQVLSIEQSLENSKATSLYSHATRHDPNWEIVKAPFFVLCSRTTLIVSSTYPGKPLRIPLTKSQILWVIGQ